MEQQRSDQPDDEAAVEVADVCVAPHDEVPVRLVERLPHRLALAVPVAVLAEHSDAVMTRWLPADAAIAAVRVAGVVVDHEHLVDQTKALDQVRRGWPRRSSRPWPPRCGRADRPRCVDRALASIERGGVERLVVKCAASSRLGLGSASSHGYHPPSRLPPREVQSAMTATVRVPTTLRTLTAGASEVEVEGATVGEVLDAARVGPPRFQGTAARRRRWAPAFRERVRGRR